MQVSIQREGNSRDARDAPVAYIENPGQLSHFVLTLNHMTWLKVDH
jgi:hypothetical protein